ncbi:MAG: hypothetical protein H7835_01765 [Magnetococcus sp. XQGC-1]
MLSGGLLLLAIAGGAGGHAADGAADCLSCHRERDGRLVTAWMQSRHHRPELDCRSCHGATHDGGMAARARRNESCSGCHARESGGYLGSKHGVIALLEAERTDFSLPLREGNMRAPTCAYCHLHQGRHEVGGVSADREMARSLPCRDCHSPRFVETWFATGERMVEIGRMKVREAEGVVQQIVALGGEGAREAEEIQRAMVGEHFKNIRLGVGHQSPDEQWWHGHPALDGDLLRLKSLLGDLLRGVR